MKKFVEYIYINEDKYKTCDEEIKELRNDILFLLRNIINCIVMWRMPTENDALQISSIFVWSVNVLRRGKQYSKNKNKRFVSFAVVFSR